MGGVKSKTRNIRNLIKEKVKKSANFLDPPPSPQQFGLFWIWEENWNLMTPPPDLIGKNLKLGKFWILGTPPQKRNISLKHLKLPKNHFKTKGYSPPKKNSIFKDIIQIEVDLRPSQPIFDKFIFDKVLIILTSLPPLEFLTKIVTF